MARFIRDDYGFMLNADHVCKLTLEKRDDDGDRCSIYFFETTTDMDVVTFYGDEAWAWWLALYHDAGHAQIDELRTMTCHAHQQDGERATLRCARCGLVIDPEAHRYIDTGGVAHTPACLQDARNERMPFA